ncbi:MAG: hypothetical protein II954_10895 [Synergistaceae bacterium]|nr:hypothetical protein [Synergistaceae bacterium]
MRKILVSTIIAVLLFSMAVHAEVIPDLETHRVIGGLYSLACAASLNGKPDPQISQLRQFFTDLPKDSQLLSKNGSLWVGVKVGELSTARRYLRTHAAELSIMESPGGYAWMSGEYAWLKADGLFLRAANGSDSGSVFLTTQGQDTWWLAHPDFTTQAARQVIAKFGVNDAPELRRPSGEKQSLYESVKPSSVRVPDKIHVGTRSKNSMDIELGTDVIFSPIPNIHRRNQGGND